MLYHPTTNCCYNNQCQVEPEMRKMHILYITKRALGYGKQIHEGILEG